MRALLFLAAGLVLAACSSSIPSSIGNPQTPGTTVQLPPVDPNHLTLQFENISPYSLLTMYADPQKFTCVTSVEPDFINLYDRQTEKVDIKGDNQGGCKDGERDVHFSTALVQIGGGRIWRGDLHVQYNPHLSAWVAKLYPGDRNVDLCTSPGGFMQGVHVEDNELIEFYFCK